MKKLLTILAAAALPALGGTRRIPAVAGRFYPSNPRSLGALVSRELAAAPVVVLPPKARIVALLVPHAGLAYSGRIAARAFKLLRRGRFDHVVIVGTCHYKELAGAALYPGDYGVPGAYLPFDSALAAALMKATPLIREDAAAHRKEHSIEVEVPFLRRMLGGVPTTALVMNTEDLDTARAVGLALARVCRNRRVLLVASSDLSHYPSGGVADAVDATTLAALSSLDPAYFWLTNRFLMSRAIPDLAVTYCGEGAVTAVLTAARELGANRLRVLGRINSGDVVPERDYGHVVGYAAAVFTREPGPVPARSALSAAEKARLLSAARASVAAAAAGKALAAPLSRDPALNLPAAVFVTLSSGKDGALRGCIGTTRPEEGLLEAVIRRAAAAARDPRLRPVSAAEASSLKIEIAVLSPLRVTTAERIEPGQGVDVERDGREGVLLPSVWSRLPEKSRFLELLCSQKAGLEPECWKRGAVLRTFSVARFGD